MIWIIVLTVIITLFSYNAIIFVIITVTDDEDITIKIACGFIYPIAYFLTYPIRAWKSYSRSINYYKKHGITRFQYVFLFKRDYDRTHKTKDGQR